MDWDIVIGIETHVQLRTKSKQFSGASIEYGNEPNSQACLVSLAYPGVLPVLNHESVNCAIKFGLAVNAEIAPRSIFARKNYFYPDLPKGYQISQFELPIVGQGILSINVNGQNKNVRILRAHLEEDAGKSSHGVSQGKTGIDLNRAGTPLLEIVTEPDMSSAEEAVAYSKKLHELVQWIGICDGNMQEGSFRCDVNVSVKKKGTDILGTRREIKNLNSFKFIKQAIDYEVNWQIETLEDGGKIDQATILFNPETGETKAMRSKEEANDYRYFPDPDLLPLLVTQKQINEIKQTMPKLPGEFQELFEKELGLSEYDASEITSNSNVTKYFLSLVDSGVNPKLSANWILGSLFSRLNEEDINISHSPIDAKRLAELIKRIEDSTISNNAAKKVFDFVWDKSDITIDKAIEDLGLKQISDSGEIDQLIDEVLKNNQAMIEEYRSGKEKAFNALVGQIMKVSKGKANPSQVNEILKKKITK
ncbi:MAG: Asp-tRNA(Asn)/Glu-tRNA(Gln) amidotransferase subunit GatB [Methylophilales bacterium]|jgi:aspartyl-tRNA(Asn)/glutamyl-tRNA(Gln) amidotransferase subunit B|nr:Asp-tRNA(Asn)/Glu-tRNA(Gln) amidotransferase subunit GatB [Pseudomonadota bacterium]NQW35283.1 Asp-tRNA(Asn)/Glu-tRNA(Gln) amidotransferase subunit GatB [Methylophilales bacterium]|tara:strand:- start:7029 stop:8462 length:1434 start_codon:yes stop_codon:yes gene_type:complete